MIPKEKNQQAKAIKELIYLIDAEKLNNYDILLVQSLDQQSVLRERKYFNSSFFTILNINNILKINKNNIFYYQLV